MLSKEKFFELVLPYFDLFTIGGIWEDLKNLPPGKYIIPKTQFLITKE